MPEPDGRQGPQNPRKNSARTGLPDLSGGENLGALADRLIDSLINDDEELTAELDFAPEPAAEAVDVEIPVAGVASAMPDAPAEPTGQPMIAVDGDHGEDIDDCLQSLFGDEPRAAATATPPADPVAEAPRPAPPAKPLVQKSPVAAAPPVGETPGTEGVVPWAIDTIAEPASSIEEISELPPPPVTEKEDVASQQPAEAQAPGMPWSQTRSKPRRGNSPRAAFPKKWIAAAMFVAGAGSLAWLVLSPGRAPVEERTLASNNPVPNRAAPAPGPPPMTLPRPEPPKPEASAPVESTPVESAPIPNETSSVSETPTKLASPVAEKPKAPESKPVPVKSPTPPVEKPAPRESKPVPTTEKPGRTMPPPPQTPSASAPRPSAQTRPVPEPAEVSAEPSSSNPVDPPSSAQQLLSESFAPTKASTPVPAEPTPSTPARIEPASSATAPTKPELVQRQDPSYKKRDGTGVVVLKVLVGETGRVSRVVIEEGIPGSPLEASAIDAALRSTYRPATEKGEPVSAWTVERFVFE